MPARIKGNHKGLPLPNVLIGSGKGFLDETDSMPANFIGGFLFCKGLLAQDYGDALVSGSIADARTLVPILASDSASAEVCGMIFNGLVKYDKDINLVGDLAESWEIQDEGLTIIFHLRKMSFGRMARLLAPRMWSLPIRS